MANIFIKEIANVRPLPLPIYKTSYFLLKHEASDIWRAHSSYQILSPHIYHVVLSTSQEVLDFYGTITHLRQEQSVLHLHVWYCQSFVY